MTLRVVAQSTGSTGGSVTLQSVLATGLNAGDVGADPAGTAESLVSSITPASIGAATPASVTSAVASEATARATAVSAITPSSIGAESAGTAATLVASVTPASIGAATPASVTSAVASEASARSVALSALAALQLPLAGGTMTGPIGGLLDRGGQIFNVKAYGAKGNLTRLTDGAMTAGSATLTNSTSAPYQTTDVGKLVAVTGAGASGVLLVTTIQAYVSSSQVTLAVSASTTVSGAVTYYGTDDSAAFQTAINAAGAVGGSVFAWGSFALGGNGTGVNGSLLPVNGVRIMGAGTGNTILYPFGTTSAFYGTFSTGSPLTDFGADGFSIDGSCQGPSFSVNITGLRAQYCSHCTFKDLVIQNCVATGLSTDYLTQGTTIHNVRSIGNGRLNQGGGSGSGSSGIGIGTGQFPVEAFVVSDCYAYGNGRYGIFVESETGNHSIGARVIGCYAEGNYNHGFGDSGCSGAVFEGCIAYNNHFSGFSVDTGTVSAIPGDNTHFVGCYSYGNSQHGFAYTGLSSNSGNGNLSFTGCKAYLNSSCGFNIAPATGRILNGLSIQNCEAYQNGADGFLHAGPGTINNLRIVGSRFSDNGQTSSSNDGIRLNASVTGFSIIDNRLYDDGTTKKQAYAIYVATGVTLTTGQIANNDLRGNLTGAISQNGTLASDVLIHDNHGYNPVGLVTVAVPASATATAVAPYPQNFYVTAGGSTVACAVTNATGVSQTVATIPSGGFGVISVPAGSSLTPTYTSAPTWSVQGL
jgi:hypothetical protein